METKSNSLLEKEKGNGKQKFKFMMDIVIQKDYELEAESRDDAEAIALADFKERHLINVNPNDVDGFARFKKEEEC